MVVEDTCTHNIMDGVENPGGVRLHSSKKKLKQRFDIIKKLGQGTYGKVQLGINKETGEEVAIKTIKKCKIETVADLVRIRREIQIMSSVHHPNIIHIYEVFENKEKMVLVMEYAAGGELYDYLSERKILDEQEARRIFRQICTAVFYCHKHKICHRDLKLENILLDEAGNAKIADFGLSNVFNEKNLLNTFCGSPLYASPEIVKGTPYQGPEVDCWSLGVLLYTLVYGAMPFDGSNFKRLVKQITHSDYFEPDKPSRASPLIKDMLAVCSTKRASIESICCHWWVNEGYEQNCLDIAESLAKQTPVRLDLLLSLMTHTPQVENVVIGDQESYGDNEASVNNRSPKSPTKRHSIGSPMELDEKVETSLYPEVSENKEHMNSSPLNEGKRKIERTSSMMDRSPTGMKKPDFSEKPKCEESIVADKRSPVTVLSPNVDAKTNVIDHIITLDPKPVTNYGIKPIKSNISQESTSKPEGLKNSPFSSNVSKLHSTSAGSKEATEMSDFKKLKKKALSLDSEFAKEMESVNELIKRRNSKIFETAERLNQLAIPALEKPKKIVIPGVDVRGTKLAFERKASLPTSMSPPFVRPIIETKTTKDIGTENAISLDNVPRTKEEEKKAAVNIITSAIKKPPMLKRLSQTSFTKSSEFGSDKSIDSRKSVVSTASIELSKPITTSPTKYTYERSVSSSSQSSTNMSTEEYQEPKLISKSPREFIIPIAVEGYGYVLPKTNSASSSIKSNLHSSLNSSLNSHFRSSRSKLLASRLSSDASEDESPYTSSFDRKSDDLYNRAMHRLQSSRSVREKSEPGDSLSSGEDDDDDGFELLTAENLFSTLLSRVKSLTERLSVDDNINNRLGNNSLFSQIGTCSPNKFFKYSNIHRGHT